MLHHRRCVLVGLLVVASSVAIGCTQNALVPPSTQVDNFFGNVSYSDGRPAAGALIGLSDSETGSSVDVIAADSNGRYRSHLPQGSYALAVSGTNGFYWLESRAIPTLDTHIQLSTDCYHLIGHTTANDNTATRIKLQRQSDSTGDTFYATLDRHGNFRSCLPEGQYAISIQGEYLSRSIKVDLRGPLTLQLDGLPADSIKRNGPRTSISGHDLDSIIADIGNRNARLIGLGEATHGTAEFFSARSEITFSLIQKLDVHLILFELDAIACAKLDSYINGGDVDLAQSVTSLGFWTTDTYEFRSFIEHLRQYNSIASEKVHIWGIDIQNTTLPVNILLANAAELAIGATQQEVIKRLTKRGKAVLELSVTERAGIDDLLDRLSTPRSLEQHDLLNSVAARSLRLQLGYWVGDVSTWSRQRRDAGMAELARYIIEQTNPGHAVLWAHDAHISKEPKQSMLGEYLGRAMPDYYSIGFYLYQGAARAWDQAGKVGVISHVIPPAPSYSVESAIMSATGNPPIAWVALRRAARPLTEWLQSPRYVREMYAVYNGNEAMMVLRNIPAAFDAVAIIRQGHDSSPTPSGIRTAEHK